MHQNFRKALMKKTLIVIAVMAAVGLGYLAWHKPSQANQPAAAQAKPAPGGLAILFAHRRKRLGRRQTEPRQPIAIEPYPHCVGRSEQDHIANPGYPPQLFDHAVGSEIPHLDGAG